MSLFANEGCACGEYGTNEHELLIAEIRRLHSSGAPDGG